MEGTDDVVCARAIAHEGEVIALDRLVLIVLAGEGAEPEAESGFEAPTKVWSVAPGVEVMLPKVEMAKLEDLLPQPEPEPAPAEPEPEPAAPKPAPSRW